MMTLKRLLPLVALLLGCLGVIACVAATVGVWSLGSRLNQANANIFDGVDKSLVVVRDRVLGAQQRVVDSKITVQDIGDGLKSWTRKETGDRLASQLEVGKKTEALAQGMRQADQWLEISEGSIQGVQQALELGSSIGAPVNVDLLTPLLETLQSLRTRLIQATETVDGIRERTEETNESESLGERIDQAAQMALRVVATLGEIDSRLGESANKLTDLENEAQRARSSMHDYIRVTQACAVLLIAWMAAGQVSLCRQGWKNFRRDRSTA